MKSSDYWKGRFEYLEGQKAKRGAEYFNNLESQYDIAIRDVERDISAWYSRFATENEISFQEAKRLLNSRELAAFRMDVKEYIEKGRSLDPQWRKQLEQASAKVHVSRLEALKVQLQQRAEWVSANQRDTIDDLARKVYSEQYYRTAFEFQKGVGIGWEFARLDTKKIDNYIVKPWAADGKNFSKRIWESRDKLVGELNTRLTQSIIRGLPPDKVIKEISGRFNVSKNAAGRLIMTESAFFATVAQKDALKELDVEKYEILATLDSKTSETCRHMDGQVFKLSEHRPGETAPPFHVYCRTTTVPYFDDEIPGERAARDNEGKYYTIPENIKYQDWEAGFVKGDKSVLDKFKQTTDLLPILENSDLFKKAGQKHYMAIHDAMEKTATDEVGKNVKAVWRRFENDLMVSDFSYRGGAHFRPGSGVNINLSVDAKGTDWGNPYRTLFHEFGHNIDYLATETNYKYFSEAYQDGIFGKTIREEINGKISDIDKLLKKEFKESADKVQLAVDKGFIKNEEWNINYYKRAGFKYSKSYAYSFFEKELKAIPIKNRAVLSDLAEGVTGGRINAGFGHGKAYWKGGLSDKVSIEAFAEFYESVTVNREQWEILKKYMPKSCELFEEMMKELGENHVR